MSRSYRKFPVAKDSHSRDRSPMKPKDFANRAVRRSKKIPSGKGGYKKLYDRYFISDYRLIGYTNKTEVLKKWETEDYIFYDTYEEALWGWKKGYIRK